ncbi:hypothetical protein B6D52_01315 [Candidatus Parcubacteria bacterium 4484_255]|nr:MAG: hypothetical protein B6D52_01315 [Candidatus Parcubacteria bacterium 4484_255]
MKDIEVLEKTYRSDGTVFSITFLVDFHVYCSVHQDKNGVLLVDSVGGFIPPGIRYRMLQKASLIFSENHSDYSDSCSQLILAL